MTNDIQNRPASVRSAPTDAGRPAGNTPPATEDAITPARQPLEGQRGGRVATTSGTRPPRVSIEAAPTGALSIRSVDSPAAVARMEATARFQQAAALEAHMNLRNPDVRKAAMFQGLNVGVGAAFAFGAGRAIGADLAEMIVRAAFASPQLAGVGEDKANFHQGNEHTAQMMATVVARWFGATLGGGIGAAAGNVLATRAARAAAGRQLLPIPPGDLVPDHVAGLLRPDGQAYGEEGVAALRAQIAQEQKNHGVIVGDTHVHAGQYAFGAMNAARGLGQGFQPMGMAPDTPLSALVSGTAGLTAGIFAAARMAGARLQVPDAGHGGAQSAPSVTVPLFRVGDPAPIPDRFTGPTAARTAANIGAGVIDRTRAMGQSTLALGAAQVTGTAIGAALPATPGDVAHRVIQAGIQGAGVWAAVEPWFKEQPVIAGHDAARRAPAATAPIPMTAPGGAESDAESAEEV